MARRSQVKQKQSNKKCVIIKGFHYKINTKSLVNSKMDQQINDQFLDHVGDTLPQTLHHKISQFQQLNLKYSYSGISNSSSSNDFILTTTRSFNEDWGKLNFVQAQRLFETLSRTAAELEKRMLISEDLILHLLYVYKWNQQRLLDLYYDRHACEYQELNRKVLEGNDNMDEQSMQNICEVCCTSCALIVTATLCHHSYCIDCWHNYIKQNLVQSKIFFPSCMSTYCPPHPILLQFVKKISTSLAELYRKKICVNYAIVNKSVSYCPSDACPLFCQKNMMTQQSIVQCPCGVFYCFRCQKEPHQPALCEQVQKWQKLTNQQKNNEEWMRKYTRKCPTCKQAVQKYVGCNYIKCICGQQFCFHCNHQWDEVHKTSPQSCVKQKPQGESTVKQEKVLGEVEKLTDKVIYLSRSMNSDMRLVKKTQQLLTKQQPLSYLKQLFQDLKSRINHAWINVKWSIVTLYMRQKPSIQEQIEKDTLQSIRNLIETVQKIQKKVQNYSTFSHMLYVDSKELLHLKEELFKRKQVMAKTLEVWNQAFKNIVDDC